MQRAMMRRRWLAACAAALGLAAFAGATEFAADLAVDAATGLPTDANYAETEGVQAEDFKGKTVSLGTRFVLGAGSYDGAFNAEGQHLRLTTGAYDAETGAVTLKLTNNDTVEPKKPITAASLYLEGGRFAFYEEGQLDNVPTVCLKGCIYTESDAFSSDFFLSPSNYRESSYPSLEYASLRIGAATPTRLSGTVTPLPKVEGDVKDCVRFSSHGSTRTLKIATLDLTRVAKDGATVLDLQKVALEVTTLVLPADFAGTLTFSGDGRFDTLSKVRLGDEPLEGAKWLLRDNRLKVRTMPTATAETAEANFPAGVSWQGDAPTHDGTAWATLTLTQDNSVVTLDPEKPLAGLKLVAGNDAVQSVTLVAPAALPYPIDWGTLKGTVRLVAPTGKIASTSDYETELAAAEPVADALTLTPNGGTLTVASGAYPKATLEDNATQTTLNFAGGDLTFAGNFAFGKANVTVSGGSITARQFATANGYSGRPTTFTQTGGAITLTSEEESSYGKAAILLGHWSNGHSTHTLSGGTLKAEKGKLWLGFSSPATLTVKGNAEVTVKGIASDQSGSALNLEGGTLKVGAWGVQSAFGFNLKGGRYVATASHTLATPAVAAEGATSTLTAEAGQTLTVSGALSGKGALTIDGEGEVRLQNLPTFEGTLKLTKGTLMLGAEHLGQVTSLASDTTLKIVSGTLAPVRLPKGVSVDGVTFTINGIAATGEVAEDDAVTVTPNPAEYTLTLSAGETLLSKAAITNAEGERVAPANLGANARLTVKATEDATLTADIAATVASLRFEVAKGKTLTLQNKDDGALATQSAEVSGNVCAIETAAALGEVYVGEGSEFTWAATDKAGAPARVFGPGTFRLAPANSRWDANGGIGDIAFVDWVGNPLWRFVLDGDGSEIRAKVALPAETLLEVRNDAEYWPTGNAMANPILVAGSVKEANTWNNEGFGFFRSGAQTFNGPVTLEEGGEAMLGTNSATSAFTFNGPVSGAGTLVAGHWYGTYATSLTLNKALPEGSTLGGLWIRNTGRDGGAGGATTVTAARDTLRGAKVAFSAGHGSNTPANVSWLRLTGDNTVRSLTAATGGNLYLAPGMTLTAQETSTLSGDFALDGVGTLKAPTLEVKGILRQAPQARTARHVRWNLLAKCPTGTTYHEAYALAEIRLQHQGEAISLSGATATASSQGGDHAAKFLIDGKLGTNNKWMSGKETASWVQLDAGEGKTFTFDGYRLAMADQDGRNPRKWEVQVSNDGKAWTTIDMRDYPESVAKAWPNNGWVPETFYPAALIETTNGLTVKAGGTLVYAARPLKGDLICEEGATLNLPQLPLTLEGSLSGSGALALPDGAKEGNLVIACANATDAVGMNFTAAEGDLKLVASAEGYRLAKNVTLQAADGAVLPQAEALLNAAYEAGLRGDVTLTAQTSGGIAAQDVAALLTCFTGLTAEVNPEAKTLTLTCDFGITRATTKTVEGLEGRWLVVEAQVRTAEGGTPAFAEGTTVSLVVSPAMTAEIVEVTDWDASTPGSAAGNARYFRMPFDALTETTTLKVRVTKP